MTLFLQKEKEAQLVEEINGHKVLVEVVFPAKKIPKEINKLVRLPKAIKGKEYNAFDVKNLAMSPGIALKGRTERKLQHGGNRWNCADF